MEGVARRRHHAQPHAPGDLDGVAVAQRGAPEGHIVVGGDAVVGAGEPGQLQPAGDVVVVDVGLDHVGDLHTQPAGQGEDAVDVALGIDDDRGLSVGRQIAAIAQGRGLDHLDADRVRGHADHFLTVVPSVGGVPGWMLRGELHQDAPRSPCGITYSRNPSHYGRLFTPGGIQAAKRGAACAHAARGQDSARKSFSSSASVMGGSSPRSRAAWQCRIPLATILNPARSSARDTAASWVSVAAQSSPSSIIEITPESWPWHDATG